MDYDKLIEQLKKSADFEDYPVVASFAAIIEKKYLREAATALSTLQAENEKLRSEAEGMRSNWYKSVEKIQKLRAELEQVKAERDAAVESIPHECKTCVYHTVFFNGCTLDHDCTNPDGGCSNNYDRWTWRGQKKD